MVRYLLVLLLIISCSTPNVLRTIASFPEVDKSFKYIDFAYDLVNKDYYFLGEDTQLYYYSNIEKKMTPVNMTALNMTVNGYQKIEYIPGADGRFVLANNSGNVLIANIDQGKFIPIQQHQATFKHLPIKSLKAHNGKILLHYSKGRPAKAVGYNFNNFLDSDINILRGNSVGFKAQNPAPTPFYSKIGFKEDEVFKVSEKEFSEMLKKYTDQRMLYSQLVEVLEFDSKEGWKKSFYNPYFSAFEHTSDLKKMIFTNKVEGVASVFDGETYQMISEDKASFAKFSKDKKTFAIASVDDAKVSLYNFDSAKLLYTLDLKEKIRHINFIGDGKIRVVVQSGKVFDFTPAIDGSFTKDLIADFKSPLARNIKLKYSETGDFSVLNNKGKRIKSSFYLNCSNLLR